MVTGAGRGLGRGIAERLAHRGYTVLATDVDASAAERTAGRLGDGHLSGALDVRDPEACRRTAAEAAGHGRLAAWVNNAGILRTEHVWEHSDADVELMVAVNLLGAVNGSRAAVGEMRRTGGGRILNVASLSALGPIPGLAVYAATKSAVLSFTASLAGDLRDGGLPIEVRSICPDAIQGDMVSERAEDPQAAVLWSGARLLTLDEVADRAVELLLGSGRINAGMPLPRAALIRALGVSPRASLRLMPLLSRMGERNRRRWRESSLGS